MALATVRGIADHGSMAGGVLVVAVLVGALAYALTRRVTRPGVFALTVVAALFAALAIGGVIGAKQCQNDVRRHGGDCEGIGVVIVSSGGVALAVGVIAGLAWALGRPDD